jgi:colicin import membrane protein
MSNSYIEAADAIRRAAKQYEMFVKTAEALDRVGSFEQAAKEADAARVKAASERDQALAELAEAKKQVTEERAAAKKARATAQQQAETLLAEAKVQAQAEAAKQAEAAAAAASKVVEDAQALAGKIRAEAQQEQVRLDGLQASVKEKTTEVAGLIAQRDQLTSAIEQLRTKFLG